MANEEKRRRFYNFPAKLMYGWWESDAKFKSCLQDGLRYVMFCYLNDCGFTLKTADDIIITALKESFNLSSVEKENESHWLAKFRKNHNNVYAMWLSSDVRSNGVFFSIDVDNFWEMYHNPKSMNDRALFVAYLSLKSMLGKKKYMLTNQLALTSRMSCRTKLSIGSLDLLPEEVAKYNTRRRRERLTNELCYLWKVAIYSFYGCHGFYVSLKKNEQGEPDIEWLAQQVNKERTLSEQAKEYRKKLLKKCIDKNKGKGYTKRTP